MRILIFPDSSSSFYRFVPSFLRLGSWNIVMFMSYEQIKRAVVRLQHWTVWQLVWHSETHTRLLWLLLLLVRTCSSSGIIEETSLKMEKTAGMILLTCAQSVKKSHLDMSEWETHQDNQINCSCFSFRLLVCAWCLTYYDTWEKVVCIE